MINNFDLLSQFEFMEELSSNILYKSIINSSAFQRLNNIHFLGAIDYTFKPNQYNKRHTRYDHSLSVAMLAIAYAKKLKLNLIDTEHVVVAALLHDIGHAPLSHSMESVFYERFGINHHVASINIIKGSVEIGKELYNILIDYKINIERVISLIDSKEDSLAGKAFSNPINIDTIDGIIRTSSYFTTPNITTLSVLDALVQPTQKSVMILDEFWKLKHRAYSTYIHNNNNIFADNLSQSIAKKKKLKKEHFYIDEKNYIKLFGSFYNEYKDVRKEKKISYSKRKYAINDSVAFNSIDDTYNRYTCSKEFISINIDLESKKYHTLALKGF